MRFQKQNAAYTAKRQLTTFINTRRGSHYYDLIQGLHKQGRSIRQIVGYLTGTGAIQSRV
jgi:hypothetical protein